MQASETRRAVAAAMATAAALGLNVEDATVLNDSNRLVLRLRPCDVVVRVARMTHHGGSSELEVEVARRLAETDSPFAAPEPRVEPRAYVRDGFVMSIWTYYEPVPPRELAPAEYALMLQRLHAGLWKIDIKAPHFRDRVADTEQWVARREVTPDLSDVDRALLVNTLRRLRRVIVDRGATEQLLHGEPHQWNVLYTKAGPLFIDFENSGRGPVEYDLAWVPREVSERYPGADQQLVGECRGLVMAIIAAHRWRRDDEHPSGPQREAWLDVVRRGPPWPALDAV